MTEANDTYAIRLARYERREQMTTWVGAAFAGAVAFVAADILKNANDLVVQMLVTVVVVGVALLAFTRVQFEWAATTLRRALQENPGRANVPLSGELAEWPTGPEKCWTLALLSIVLTWALVLIGVWWPQLSSIVRSLTNACSG